MLYAMDVKNIPMHYIEADSTDEAVGIMRKIAEEKGEPFVLQTIYVKENFIRKEQDMSCIGCKWEDSCEKECVRNDYNDWYTKEV